MPIVEIKPNLERAVLQALRDSDLSSVPLEYSDLANCLALIDGITTLQQAKTALKKLLKAIALVYVELERRERANR